MFDNMIGSERPLSWVLQFWPVLLFSFIFAFAATWFCKKLAIKLDIVDNPDQTVKTHKEPVAYLGGLGILGGLTVGILAGIYILRNDPSFNIALKWLLGILGGGAIACFVGLVDDIMEITPKQKIIGQLISAGILILAGVLPTGSLVWICNILNIPFSENLLKIIGGFLVIIFVLGASNSLNLLDGLDGLCAGVTGVITLAMLTLAIHLGTWYFSNHGDPVRIIICLGLVGGVAGFLPFNRHPAKIFMGDAGSMLLGFMMAALMILFAEQIPRWWLASIIIFGLPILDTATAFARRFLNKRSIFVSDRGHIYDQMMDRGLTLMQTVRICYLLAAIYAIIGLIMSQIRTRYAVIVYIIVVGISAFAIWKKGYLKMEGLRGAVKKGKTADIS